MSSLRANFTPLIAGACVRGFAAVAILLLVAVAHADEYGLDAWTTANGLPQNTVTGIAQTPDGYLWLSTFDGLARFDGVRFTVFDKGNTKGIVNNRFSGIYADPEGKIWAVTENGAVTVYQNGAFASFQMKGISEGPITLVRDQSGQAMIESGAGSFYLRDGVFAAVEPLEPGVKRVFYALSGSKWVFSENEATQFWEDRVITYKFALPRELFSRGGTDAFHGYRGDLWIRLSDRFVWLSSGTVHTYPITDFPEIAGLDPQWIFDDPGGGVWIVCGGTDPARSPNTKLVKFLAGRSVVYDLGEKFAVTRGETDREGNIWLATPVGLRRIRKKLITTLSVKDGLNRNEVYPLLETAAGDVLIGTVQGVNRFRNGAVEDLKLKYSAGFPLYMRGLWQNSRGQIWLGYQGEGGFGRFDEPSTVTRIGKGDLPNGATDFAQDSDGNVWVATETGLLKYTNETETAHYTVADGLRSNAIITLRFDRAGDLWLGTYDGLSLFKDGKFTNFADVEGSPQGFVRAIYEDADGVIWFGTYGDGLVRYKDGKFFNYRVENGLFNNGVFAILEDGRGNLWMSSNRGIHRVSKQELNDLADGRIPKLNSVAYDEKDGMLNVECNGGRNPAAVKTRDGRLWFATMGGVAIVDPNAEGANTEPPPALIENVLIDRKPAIRDARRAIEVEAGRSNVAIEYTGLSLKRSAQIKFRYQLEGLEDSWIEAGTRRSVDYSYLPAGSYTFRVVAGNSDGVWDTKGDAVTIVVRPYFYQTWWFRLFGIILAILIIGTLYDARVRRLRAVAEAKTTFSRRLIESQEAERKRIAVDLHDGLGQNLVVIKNRAMLGLSRGDDPERVSKELSNISETASEALEEVREITNNLRPRLLDSLGLTKAIKAMIKKLAGVIEIDSEVDPIDGIFSESQEICIYRIVQESLGNVVKHSDASEAIVRIKRDLGRVLISIEDNGKGFDLSDRPQGGLGLVGLEERAQILGAEISIESTPGAGTRIGLKVPVPGYHR